MTVHKHAFGGHVGVPRFEPGYEEQEFRRLLRELFMTGSERVPNVIGEYHSESNRGPMRRWIASNINLWIAKQHDTAPRPVVDIKQISRSKEYGITYDIVLGLNNWGKETFHRVIVAELPQKRFAIVIQDVNSMSSSPLVGGLHSNMPNVVWNNLGEFMQKF
jgi:hypothetical protein